VSSYNALGCISTVDFVNFLCTSFCCCCNKYISRDHRQTHGGDLLLARPHRRTHQPHAELVLEGALLPGGRHNNRGRRAMPAKLQSSFTRHPPRRAEDVKSSYAGECNFSLIHLLRPWEERTENHRIRRFLQTVDGVREADRDPRETWTRTGSKSHEMRRI
jgi:hypothetical protein